MGDKNARSSGKKQELTEGKDQYRERVNFLKVPVDIVVPENLVLLVHQLLAEDK